MNTRVIILAAGEGSRWANYRGTPKHQVVVEGEILIERLHKQFSKYSDDIIIVGEYKIQGCKNYLPDFDSTWLDMAKLWGCKSLWSNERTLLVFGDVYFTDKAVKRIMSNNQDIVFFLRKQGSHLTGKKGGEIFAIGFNGVAIDILQFHILDIIESKQAIKAGGWHLYNSLKKKYDHNLHIIINDWTEDFDYPRDLDRWENNKKKRII